MDECSSVVVGEVDGGVDSAATVRTASAKAVTVAAAASGFFSATALSAAAKAASTVGLSIKRLADTSSKAEATSIQTLDCDTSTAPCAVVLALLSLAAASAKAAAALAWDLVCTITTGETVLTESSEVMPSNNGGVLCVACSGWLVLGWD